MIGNLKNIYQKRHILRKSEIYRRILSEMSNAARFSSLIVLLIVQSHFIQGAPDEAVYEAYGDYWDQNINNQILTQKRDHKLVGAFNLDNFNVDKLGHPVPLRILPLIIRRYDLLTVSGIYDKDKIAMDALLAMANENNRNPYALSVSDPSAGAGAKEQFGLFYKKLRYEVQEFTVYEDTKHYFRKPPMVALIKYKFSSAAPAFGVINVHLSAKFTANETDALHEVVEWVKNKFSVQDVVVAGDFNSGCGNLKDEDWEDIRLWTMPEYKWIIPKDLLTTIERKQCAHDKIVITGQWMKEHTFVSSGRVFQFDKAYNLDTKEAIQVSKHRPVEVVMSSGATDGNE